MAGLSDRIYANIPVSLQNLVISGYGFTWSRRRFGGVFEKHLHEFKDREAFNAQQWRDYQTVQLRSLLLHAYETVPYYHHIYGMAGFSEKDFQRFELEDLKRLPFLDKEELRQFGKTQLISTRLEKGGNFFASSGSTGTPTSILYSRAFHQRWSAAFEARIRHWAGLTRQMPRGMIGGRRIIQSAKAPPPYYRYNRCEKQTYFSAYHISRKTAADYLDGIYKHRVEYMTGYAMSNYFLAGMFQELALKPPTLRAVVVSSEKLTPLMREVFRKVYGCRTYDSYSGVEACGLISENEHGELVVSPDVGIMEVIDEKGREVTPGEWGEVVSTGFLNYDQPLIRYRIGDLVRRAADQNSKSGRNMPLIGEILGRVEDKIVGPDGREMVRFHGLFTNLRYLLCAQVVQEALDRITVRVIVESGFSAAEERLIAERVKSQLGDVGVTVVRMTELPRNANGKVQAVISNLQEH